MAEYKANEGRDGKGGMIKFPFMISQADMDLIEQEFIIRDGDVFVVTFPRSGTTWTNKWYISSCATASKNDYRSSQKCHPER